METPRERREGSGERRNVPRTITPLSMPAIESDTGLKFPLKQVELQRLVHSALEEDQAFNDITTIATVVSDRRARATLVARATGTISGMPLALESFRLLDPKVSIRVDREDGVHVRDGEPLAFVTGHARGVLAAERVALNFMQHMSGIATLTAKYVEAVAGTGAKILDTRKTTPGWRALEKYAVRCGGGTNHRFDLASAILIKDNHLVECEGDVQLAVRRARDLAAPGTKIEVECDRLEQVEAAIAAKADIVLLDNMSTDVLRQCVALVAGRATIEASGGVNLSTVRAIAETGVDWISIGKLTHSAPALDLALDFD
ncbi:MAG TPA: carboxylating nicotinate-nucleotide diphosphorylase [Gemmatimonadaceae bacterium]|nr:carboxylating nicotinate-nucleotide diphosphorylase [Gemmatimonadaceae bacterium]